MGIKPVLFNLYAILHDNLEIEKSIALQKRIEFTYDIDKGIELKADINMLQLMVRNLVNNAIKFTEAGGKILIRAQIVDQNCHLIVQDSGIGISYESRAKCSP